MKKIIGLLAIIALMASLTLCGCGDKKNSSVHDGTFSESTDSSLQEEESSSSSSDDSSDSSDSSSEEEESSSGSSDDEEDYVYPGPY